jgi:hypothetical protein
LRHLELDGMNLALPHRLSHRVECSTRETAEVLASILRREGYDVEFVDEDPDYQRWTVDLLENEMILTEDAIQEARSRLASLVSPRGGKLTDMGVNFREEEQYVVDDIVADAYRPAGISHADWSDLDERLERVWDEEADK